MLLRDNFLKHPSPREQYIISAVSCSIGMQNHPKKTILTRPQLDLVELTPFLIFNLASQAIFDRAGLHYDPSHQPETVLLMVSGRHLKPD